MNTQFATPAGHGLVLPIPEYGRKQQFFSCGSNPSPSIGRNPVFPAGRSANLRCDTRIRTKYHIWSTYKGVTPKADELPRIAPSPRNAIHDAQRKHSQARAKIASVYIE